MSTYLLIFIISSVSVFGNVLLKKFQQQTKTDVLTFCVVNFVNSITASLFFFSVNKFNINMNLPAFVFSMAAAFFVATAIIANMLVMSKATVAVVSIITTSGMVVGTAVFGTIFLNEPVCAKTVVAIIFVIMAVVSPFVSGKKQNDKKRFVGKVTIILCTLLFLVSGADVVLSKAYVINPNVCDTNSYFFMMNFILVILTLVVGCTYAFKNKISAHKIIHTFSPKQLLYIVVRTVTSNMGAMISVVVLAKTDASLYSVLTSSLVLIGNGVVSTVIFKEKITFTTLVSILLAFGAVVVAG